MNIVVLFNARFFSVIGESFRKGWTPRTQSGSKGDEFCGMSPCPFEGAGVGPVIVKNCGDLSFRVALCLLRERRIQLLSNGSFGTAVEKVKQEAQVSIRSTCNEGIEVLSHSPVHKFD